MALTMDETQNNKIQNNETQSTIRPDEGDVFPPTLELARLEPPMYPALPPTGGLE